MNDYTDPTQQDFVPPAGNLFGLSGATAGSPVDDADAIAAGHATWSPFGGSSDLAQENVFGSDPSAASQPEVEAPEPRSRSARVSRPRRSNHRRPPTRILAVSGGLLAVIACLVIASLNLSAGAGRQRLAVTRRAHPVTAADARRPASPGASTLAAQPEKSLPRHARARPRVTGRRQERASSPRPRRRAVSRRRPPTGDARPTGTPVRHTVSVILTPVSDPVLAGRGTGAPATTVATSQRTPTTSSQEFGFER